MDEKAGKTIEAEFDRVFKEGDVVRYFKRDLFRDGINSLENFYQIFKVARDFYTKEKHVMIVALVGDHPVYTVPLKRFMKEVDHTEFPDIKQKYIFERISNEDSIKLLNMIGIGVKDNGKIIDKRR